MRKCVSMVAVASAALGLAACSASDGPRESAGATQPLGAQGTSDAGSAAQAVVRAHRAHAAPAVPVGSGTAAAKAGAGGRNAQQQPGQPGPGARRDAVTDALAPVLIPSGTTDVVPQPTQVQGGVERSAAMRDADSSTVPALPLPAPPPPVQDRRGPDANPGYDPNASASAQVMAALAQAQQDGKAVLLDFGANWCTACKALDRALQMPRAQAILARSYHVVRIDLGDADPQHMALATQYAAFGTFGMPLLVVLDADGTVRANSALTGQPKYTEADMAAWLSQYGPR